MWSGRPRPLTFTTRRSEVRKRVRAKRGPMARARNDGGWLRIQFQTAKLQKVFNPLLRANGSRECAPDNRLREAIHWRRECSKRRMDCFVARAPRNDVKS